MSYIIHQVQYTTVHLFRGVWNIQDLCHWLKIYIRLTLNDNLVHASSCWPKIQFSIMYLVTDFISSLNNFLKNFYSKNYSDIVTSSMTMLKLIINAKF